MAKISFRAQEAQERELFALGQLTAGWPTYNGVPAQPTHRRVLGGKKAEAPYPGASKFDASGQARRPGTWCSDDEFCGGEGNFAVELMSPEDALLTAIDNRREEHEERELQMRIALNEAAITRSRISGKEARRRSAKSCARQVEVVVMRHGKSCGPMDNVHAPPPAKPTTPVVVEPQREHVAPKPQFTLKANLRLKSFADLQEALALHAAAAA